MLEHLGKLGELFNPVPPIEYVIDAVKDLVCPLIFSKDKDQDDKEERPEHTKRARPSTKEKHEKGRAREKRDRPGGEKGDERRPYRR